MSSRDRDTGFNFLFMRVYERDKGFILFCFVYFSIVGYVDPTGDNYRVMTFTQKIPRSDPKRGTTRAMNMHGAAFRADP